MHFWTDYFALWSCNQLDVWIIAAELSVHVFESSFHLEHAVAAFFGNKKNVDIRKNVFYCFAGCFFVPKCCAVVYVKSNLSSFCLEFFYHVDCESTGCFAQSQSNSWCIEHSCFFVNVFRNFRFLDFCDGRIFAVVNNCRLARISSIFVKINSDTSFWRFVPDDKVVADRRWADAVFDESSKLILWKTGDDSRTAA